MVYCIYCQYSEITSEKDSIGKCKKPGESGQIMVGLQKKRRCKIYDRC